MAKANRKGRITSGVSADAAALETLAFVEKHLPAWRDDPDRPRSERERDLNSQLCKYLNVAAQTAFPMVHFHHEEPQGIMHSADLSANPADVGWIEGIPYTKYEPIVFIEGKRLPTPGSGREREYVASEAGTGPGGGIQRFKLGLHGMAHSIAGMIGYIQERQCANWFMEVNQWIDELVLSGDPMWSDKDRLDGFTVDAGTRVSRCASEHTRSSGVSPAIRLAHVWVEM